MATVSVKLTNTITVVHVSMADIFCCSWFDDVSSYEFFHNILSPVLLWYLSTVLSMDTEVELDTSSGSREFDV